MTKNPNKGTPPPVYPSTRGFASMTAEQRRAIASAGGRAAHEKGTAHRWTSEEAKSAGSRGGRVSRGGRGRLVSTTPDR